MKNLSGYRYLLFVPNLALPLVKVWRIYCHRANSGNRLHELKHDLNLAGF
ncbi:MAG: hypothetical protein H0W49_11190 [Nitrospirales bacterium]|nr:hypothetical protein [Nitrospirales bacterium]MBA3965447.1 hypothetical protein [Nitrospirales bacterium]